LWVGVLLLRSTQLAEAQKFNQLIGFGDSTTDTGWFAHASTGSAAFDTATASAIAAGGNAHFTCPGTNYSQILGGFFGLSANPANTPGGTNFAIGGAVDFLVPPGFPGTETGNLFPNPALPGTATQIGNYLASVGGRANPNALYVLSSGANDVSAARTKFGAFSAAGVNYLLGEAQILANSIAQLQAAGAHYIILSNYYPTPSTNAATSFYGSTVLTATRNDLAAPA
jgi:outer membrane lipase/esterase